MPQIFPKGGGPRVEPAPGQEEPYASDQIKNSAGGYVWEVDDFNRLRRFLCLGSESPKYSSGGGNVELGKENANTILRMIKDGNGQMVVDEIQTFSTEGRAAKQQPTLFALAVCARSDDVATRRAAYRALPYICRIPTHLFEFIGFAESASSPGGTGWGRAQRRAIANWYNRFADDPKKLAMHVTKYRNRHGWSHKDVIRLAHLTPVNQDISDIVLYVMTYSTNAISNPLLGAFLRAVESVRQKTEVPIVVELIQNHGLVWEHIPTTLLKNTEVWMALLVHMPMMAMIRNLGRMTAIGMFEVSSPEEEIVVNKLADENELQRARIHPFNVLLAVLTYKKGAGDKGKLKWEPNQNIVAALDAAFYLSFKFVEPTNKKYLLAIDVSASMTWGGVNGSDIINAREASAALAMVTLRTEKNCDVVGFSTNLVPIAINRDMDLDAVISNIERIPMGGTDCAQPMIYAKERDKTYDAFIVYTDSETWAGRVHPAEALRLYRRSSKIYDAKLIVCAMTSNGFTLADPNDRYMLDMVGFDSSGPEVMRNFVLGRL